jgi:hypothetical protein
MTTCCWTFHAPYGTNRMEISSALLTSFDARRPKQAIYHVLIQSRHHGYEVRIADSGIIQQMPGNLGWLFEADLTNAGNDILLGEARYELTPVDAGATHTLILVKSTGEVLSYENQSRPHFTDTMTWVGADGPGLTVQSGAHRSPVKMQLFRLEPGQHILFFDSNSEVTRITAGEFGTEPVVARATSGEVADYVLGEAKKRGHENPKTRAWCFYALQELGCQHQIDAFNQLFPDFHRQ